MSSFTVVKAHELANREKKASAQALRCLTSEFGVLTRQDGSVSLSQGDTTSIAVVYGPAEVRINRELIDKATVEVIYKPKVGLPRPSDRKRERIIRNTLETAIVANLYPRSTVTIVIQETEDMGSNLACCLNAACMALLDAAVDMNFMIAAVSVAVKEDDRLVLDPSKADETQSKSLLTFVFDSLEKKVVTVVTSGKCSQEQYKQCLDLTREASSSVFQFYRDSISKKLIMSS